MSDRFERVNRFDRQLWIIDLSEICTYILFYKLSMKYDYLEWSVIYYLYITLYIILYRYHIYYIEIDHSIHIMSRIISIWIILYIIDIISCLYRLTDEGLRRNVYTKLYFLSLY